VSSNGAIVNRWNLTVSLVRKARSFVGFVSFDGVQSGEVCARPRELHMQTQSMRGPRAVAESPMWIAQRFAISTVGLSVIQGVRYFRALDPDVSAALLAGAAC